MKKMILAGVLSVAVCGLQAAEPPISLEALPNTDDSLLQQAKDVQPSGSEEGLGECAQNEDCPLECLLDAIENFEGDRDSEEFFALIEKARAAGADEKTLAELLGEDDDDDDNDDDGLEFINENEEGSDE